MADTARQSGSTGANYLDSDIGGSQLAPVEVNFGKLAFVPFTPTLSVAGAYVAGDYVGKSTAPESATGFTRLALGKARISQLVLTDKAAQSAALDIWLLTTTFTAPTDNGVWAISDTELLTAIGFIKVAAADYSASSNNSMATVRLDPGLAIQPVSGTTLFVAIVSRGTPTYAAGDLTLNFGIDQNY